MGAISTVFTLDASVALNSLRNVHRSLVDIERLKSRASNIPLNMTVTGLDGVEQSLLRIANRLEKMNINLKVNNGTINNIRNSTQKVKDESQKVTKEMQKQQGLSGNLTRILIRSWAAISGIRGLFMAINAGLNVFDASLQMANKTATALRNSLEGTNLTGLQAARIEMDKMYVAAQNARTGYMEFVSTASKFMIVAPGAFATDTDAIRFTETLSKSLQLAGASGEEVNSVLLQVSQGLSSGYLQGDELRALRENGGMAAIALAEHLGVTVGGLKELGAQGAITAEVLVAALAGAADEIDAHFANLPKTISQQMAIAKNYIQKGIEPISRIIRNFLNSKQFERYAETFMKAWDNIVGALTFLVGFIIEVVIPAFVGFLDIINWVLTSSDVLAVFIRTVLIIALMLLTAYVIRLGWQFVITGLKAIASMLGMIGPIGWVILGIGLLAAALVSLITGFQDVSTQSSSTMNNMNDQMFVLGYNVGYVLQIVKNVLSIILIIIVYLITVVVSAIAIVIMAVISIFAVIGMLLLTIIMAIINAWQFLDGAMNWIAGGIQDAAGAAAYVLADMFVGAANTAIKAINAIIDAINNIPGLDLGQIGALAAPVANDFNWGASNTAEGLQKMGNAGRGFSNIGDLWSSGMSGLGDMFGTVLGGIWDVGGGIMSNLGHGVGSAIDAGNAMGKEFLSMPNEEFELGGGNGGGNDGAAGAGGGGGGALGSIADDTNDIKNLLERMKDLAERNAVAKFTSVNVNIDMNNQIEQTDLDGVITYVTDSVNGAMNNSLAGVII